MKLLLAFAVFVSLAAAMPQRGRNTSPRLNEERRNTNDGEPVPQFSPATRPAVLYIRPLFDRQGRLIQDEEVPEEKKEQIQDTDSVEEEDEPVEQPSENQRRLDALRRLQQEQREAQDRRRAEATEAARRRQQGARNTLRNQPDPVDFEESLFGEGGRGAASGFDQELLADIRLPTFSKPETILKATEELKQLDRNQVQFIKTKGSHAGVLPLAFESTGSLNLFPPLRPAKRLPE